MMTMVMDVVKAFHDGKPIYGIFYFPGIRTLEKLELVNEFKTSYRCRYTIWEFDVDTNRLISKREGVLMRKKKDMNFYLYHLSFDDAVRDKIEHIRSEIDYLENKKLPGLKKELANLERSFSERWWESDD